MDTQSKTMPKATYRFLKGKIRNENGLPQGYSLMSRTTGENGEPEYFVVQITKRIAAANDQEALKQFEAI